MPIIDGDMLFRRSIASRAAATLRSSHRSPSTLVTNGWPSTSSGRATKAFTLEIIHDLPTRQLRYLAPPATYHEPIGRGGDRRRVPRPDGSRRAQPEAIDTPAHLAGSSGPVFTCRDAALLRALLPAQPAPFRRRQHCPG